jgi:hypothetical protein
MNSPFAALTWEIWCRHRKRLLTMLFVILGFALFYSKLCQSIGLNLDSPDMLDSFSDHAVLMHGGGSEILQAFTWLIFMCAPVACLVISLLYVTWIFTFTDRNSRELFSFPKRFFTLPLSTRFLASQLIGSGTAAILLVYLGWTWLVQLPHIKVFDGFNDGLTWITLLILSQAIVWSLDAFPFIRVLLLIAVAFFLFVHPDFQWYHSLAAHQTAVQLLLIFIGSVLAFVGLGKIRHGSWQGWFWACRLPFPNARTELREPKSFRSAAQAQFWFEWRRQGRKLFYIVCALTVVPFLIVVPQLILHQGSVSGDPTFGLCIYLLAVPLFIHFCMQGTCYERTILPFTANRPLNNGEIIVAQWQAMAFSAVLSWAVTLVLVGVVILVGDPNVLHATLPSPPENQRLIRPLIPVILLGLVICTWACGVGRAWIGMTMGTWIYWVYMTITWIVFGLGSAWLFAITYHNTMFRQTFFQLLPSLLACLVGLKFFLAQWSFRTAFQSQRIAPLTLIRYLCIWLSLTVLILVPVVVVCHQESGMLPLYLGIILLLPLARIGFAPLALDYGRHR